MNENANPFYLPGDCAVWGLIRGAKQIKQNARALGFNYYALDNGYVVRDRWFRITRNGFQNTEVFERPPDRWERLKQTIAPWRKDGRRILLCESSHWCDEYLGVQGWRQKTFREIRKHTDRKVVVRDKPPWGTIVDFPAALKDVFAVVTNVSACAVEALLHGVPVFVTGPSIAKPLAETDLSQIEHPRYPEREPWAWNLAYSQFNEWDMFTGRAKALLDEHPVVYDHL